MDVGMQTGDEEGRWKRETEEVYPKIALNFLLALVSLSFIILIAGLLEAAYSLNWGAREIWGKGGGETLALL